MDLDIISKMDLDTYRKQIDKIDLQIIWLLKRRFDIVKNKILPHKRNLNIKSIQSQRYKQIIKNLTQESDILISKKFIKTLRDIIHQNSVKLQK
jgi:chorismate mutase